MMSWTTIRRKKWNYYVHNACATVLLRCGLAESGASWRGWIGNGRTPCSAGCEPCWSGLLVDWTAVGLAFRLWIASRTCIFTLKLTRGKVSLEHSGCWRLTDGAGWSGLGIRSYTFCSWTGRATARFCLHVAPPVTAGTRSTGSGCRIPDSSARDAVWRWGRSWIKEDWSALTAGCVVAETVLGNHVGYQLELVVFWLSIQPQLQYILDQYVRCVVCFMSEKICYCYLGCSPIFQCLLCLVVRVSCSLQILLYLAMCSSSKLTSS